MNSFNIFLWLLTQNTWIFSTVLTYFLLPLCETEHRGVHAIPLELKFGWQSYFWMQIFWYTSQPAQNFWDSDLWFQEFNHLYNQFMICPHHPTFYKMQSDLEVSPLFCWLKWYKTKEQRSIFIFSGNSLWKSNCKLDKNYKHKIVRRMCVGAFNNLQTLASFYLSHFVSTCTFLYLTIRILFISFLFHRYCVFKSCSQAFL